MSDELKACPFCPDGGNPVQFMSSIYCRECGAETVGRKVKIKVIKKEVKAELKERGENAKCLMTL